MEYRKFGETYYIRMDKGDEIISKITEVCKSEGILSAYFTGIYDPETGTGFWGF